ARGAWARRQGEVHLPHPGQRGGACCSGQGGPPNQGRRCGARLPAGVPRERDHVRQHQGSGGGGREAAPQRPPLRAPRSSRHAAAHHLSRALARRRQGREGLVMSVAAETHPILPPQQSLGDVTDQIARIPLAFPTRRRWLIALACSSLLLLLFITSVIVLFTRGVGVWGLNIPVNWAFAIHNYVWWLGIGHAGTLISALLLLMGREWRNSL